MPASTSASSSRLRKAPAKTAARTAAKALAKTAARPARKAAAKKTPATPVPAAKVKQKLVRDSFTMPQVDFDLIDALKARALKSLRPVKKSELLRAGLQALVAMSDAQLQAALEALTPLKPGRPKKQA